MRIEQAINFVQAHGDTVAQARLAYLLDQTPPPATIVEQLLTKQHPDGGWAPFWAPHYASLDATCFRLAQAEALGLVPSSPAAQRALQFLVMRQAANGTWSETPPSGTALPRWLTTEGSETVCYLTANCGFWLTLFPDARAAVERAATFLDHQIRNDGGLPGPPHATWLALGIWHTTGDVRRRQAAEVSLQQHVASLSASNLAWALTCFAIAGVDEDETLINTMRSRLQTLQRADGGWSSDDGAAGDTHTTLEALRVLQASAQ